MKKSGFTLIELLVVIAIIGLFSSVVLASLNSARAKARDARRRVDLRNIATALELYYDKYGSYPVSVPNCQGLSGDSWCRECAIGANWIPGLTEFMNPLPVTPTPLATSPGSTGGWCYHYYGNGQQYWLMVKLHSVAPDTCGGGSPILWVDGVTDWCATDPANNYAVYVRVQR